MSRQDHFDAGHNMPEHNVAPGRFRYSPSTWSPDVDPQEEVIDNEYVVHVGKDPIGVVTRRPGTTEGYYGAWKGGGHYFPNRRAASMHVWNKHIAKKNEDQADG